MVRACKTCPQLIMLDATLIAHDPGLNVGSRTSIAPRAATFSTSMRTYASSAIWQPSILAAGRFPRERSVSRPAHRAHPLNSPQRRIAVESFSCRLAVCKGSLDFFSVRFFLFPKFSHLLKPYTNLLFDSYFLSAA